MSATRGPVLVLGRSGQVARALTAAAAGRGLPCLSLGRGELDLAAGAALAAALDRVQPSAVINAAAYTAVDRAEDEPDAAFRLNRDVPGEIARACAERALPFVHFSTDYVFDGAGDAPYAEDHPRRALNVYGRSKAEGEDAVAAAGGRWIVLRTSAVYAAQGTNFVTTMLRLAGACTTVEVVDDQLTRPTWAADCARAALLATASLAEGGDSGVLHLAGGGEATWAEFAAAIFAGSAAHGGPAAEVRPVSTAAFGARAVRPADARLDDAAFRARFAWGPSPWRSSLGLCLDEITAAG